MNNIDRETIEQASYLVAALDHNETGDIHTITLAIDSRTGDCQVKVESALAKDIVLLLPDSTRVE